MLRVRGRAMDIEMEEKGEAFYGKAQDECKNEPGKEIWRMLRADELVHKQRIKKLYNSLDADQGWNEELFAEEVDTKKLDSFFKKIIGINIFPI